MGSSMLNVDQTAGELDGIYQRGYYWYLHSIPFRVQFLMPLGAIVNRLGQNCLDVGCGEGWLSEYIPAGVSYMGIDASPLAIASARMHHPCCGFAVDRIENPTSVVGRQFRTIIMGNILWLLVKPECRVAFVEGYLRFGPEYLIIYDLEPLDTSAIDDRFRLVDQHHASVELDGIDEIKKHRKILVYECR